jgi:transposase
MRVVAEVVIGVDAHKRTHTPVATDELGRELAAKTVQATAEGHLAGLAWADRRPARRWAVEDCRHLTRTLEGALVRAGEQVVRVRRR